MGRLKSIVITAAVIIFLSLLSTMLFLNFAFADNLDGAWQYEFDNRGAYTDVTFHQSNKGKSLTGTIESGPCLRGAIHPDGKFIGEMLLFGGKYGHKRIKRWFRIELQLNKEKTVLSGSVYAKQWKSGDLDNPTWSDTDYVAQVTYSRKVEQEKQEATEKDKSELLKRIEENLQDDGTGIPKEDVEPRLAEVQLQYPKKDQTIYICEDSDSVVFRWKRVQGYSRKGHQYKFTLWHGAADRRGLIMTSDKLDWWKEKISIPGNKLKEGKIYTWIVQQSPDGKRWSEGRSWNFEVKKLKRSFEELPDKVQIRESWDNSIDADSAIADYLDESTGEYIAVRNNDWIPRGVKITTPTGAWAKFPCGGWKKIPALELDVPINKPTRDRPRLGEFDKPDWQHELDAFDEFGSPYIYGGGGTQISIPIPIAGVVG